jgi:hypothetical protein
MKGADGQARESFYRKAGVEGHSSKVKGPPFLSLGIARPFAQPSLRITAS